MTFRLYRGAAGAKVVAAQSINKQTNKNKNKNQQDVLRVEEQPSQMSILIHRKSGKESCEKVCLNTFLKKSKTPEKTTSKNPF